MCMQDKLNKKKKDLHNMEGLTSTNVTIMMVVLFYQEMENSKQLFKLLMALQNC